MKNLCLSFWTVAVTATFALSAHANTIAATCQLSQVYAVSPLKENLNYTQGSGRGADAVFTVEGTKARIGNLTFDIAARDLLQLKTAPGERVYSAAKAETGIVFRMTITDGSNGGYNGGIYGPAPASGPRSARLTYVSHAQPVPVLLGTFLCN
jgi:hypothetical protein